MKEKTVEIAPKSRTKLYNAIIIIINIVLIFTIVVSFYSYDSNYKSMLYEQNVDEISNINEASAHIASSFFSGREAKLRDLSLYASTMKFSVSEFMEYVASTNSDATKEFEILDENLQGYRVNAEDALASYPVDYSNGYKELKKLLTKNIENGSWLDVRYAPEFSDAYTALKSFGIYNIVQLTDGLGRQKPYTLMIASTSSDFADKIRIDSGYSNLSTAIINYSGEYIIGNTSFQSDDFFSFLSVFNDLTLDEANAYRNQMLVNDRGAISLSDGRGRPCVYVYTKVPEKDWYCISMVPIADFHNGTTEFTFALMIVLLMLGLFAIDMMYLVFMNQKMKTSAENERVASAAKTDFLSRMSHDMRTPMNGIMGMTRLTQEIPNLPAEAQDNLSAISDSSTYLLQLINDTLDMNKIESNRFTLNPGVINFEAMVRHALQTITPLAEAKDIHIVRQRDDHLPANVVCDKLRVQQILLNVLSNAIKFSEDGGEILLKETLIASDEVKATVEMTIVDHGCGMNQEYLTHIFEPFSQEKTRIVSGQEGTGLGMSIVKSLVDMMGGKIDIQSELGKGTTVAITLTFAQTELVEALETTNVDDEEEETNILEGKRILLCEDHPLNVTIAKRLLEKKGVKISVAENGEMGVSIFETSAPHTYDAILMDIRMPVMNGLEATKKIRSLSKEDARTIPIIAMTANAYSEDVDAALLAGMNAHLAKPIDPDLLYQTVAKYV